MIKEKKIKKKSKKKKKKYNCFSKPRKNHVFSSVYKSTEWKAVS